MKTKKSLFTLLYWLFIFGFILQIIAVGWYFYQVSADSKYSKSVLRIHSYARIFPDSTYVSWIPTVNKDSTIDVSINQMPFSRSSISYNSFHKVSLKAWIVLFLNVSQYFVWLLFTWQLLKVFKSLQENKIFEKRNIGRLRVVAFVVGISPIIELLRNIIYPSLFAENAVLQHHRIAYYYDYSMFAGIFYMIIILLVVEIFKYGISLKEEQDLTV